MLVKAGICSAGPCQPQRVFRTCLMTLISICPGGPVSQTDLEYFERAVTEARNQHPGRLVECSCRQSCTSLVEVVLLAQLPAPSWSPAEGSVRAPAPGRRRAGFLTGRSQSVPTVWRLYKLVRVGHLRMRRPERPALSPAPQARQSHHHVVPGKELTDDGASASWSCHRAVPRGRKTSRRAPRPWQAYTSRGLRLQSAEHPLPLWLLHRRRS